MDIYRDIFICLFVIYSPVLLMIFVAYLLEKKRLFNIMKILERRVKKVTCKKCGGLIKEIIGTYIIMKICQSCNYESVERIQKKMRSKKEICQL